MRPWSSLLVLPLLFVACSDDPAPPPPAALAFQGASWAAPDKEGNLVVQWARVDGATKYRVYSSVNQGRTLKHMVREIDAAAAADGSPIVLNPSVKGSRHFIIVRAVDARGAEDGNTVERAVTASPDTTPPTFAGAKVISPQPNAGVTVTWEAAVDDASPPEALAYEVFAGQTVDRLRYLGRTKPGERTFSASTLGEPATPYVFVVHARDVADNVSGDPSPITAALGPDATAPTFGGCGDVTDIGAKSATLDWAAATDDHAAQADLSYEVYLSETPKGQDFTKPFAKVDHDTKVVLDGLSPGKSYYLVCRARDAAGNIDTNTTEKTFNTPNDGVAPTFDGVASAVVDGINRTAHLTWPAATDDQTPQGSIVYDVYESETTGQYAFDAPPKLTTAAGVTNVDLNDITPRATLYWVVRARDAAKNHDANTKELTGTTLTSFARNVQPLFTRSCAVVGCHVSGIEPAGLNLVPGIAYGKLVNVPAGEKGTMMRIAPNDLNNSYLYAKINGLQGVIVGSQMPAPQTGSVLTQAEKDLVTSWILEGAPNN